MGLLFLDITPKGLIMGSDSTDVILYNGRFSIIKHQNFKKAKVAPLDLNNFKGLLGYVGTEIVSKRQVLEWLQIYISANRKLNLSKFCIKLSESLATAWREEKRRSGLWIFIAGYEGKDERFWFINNIRRLDGNTLQYYEIGEVFKAVNDLDENYIPKFLDKFPNKKQVIKNTIFNFRNGALFPFILIYDVFNKVINLLVVGHDKGFNRPRNLRDYSFIARQRFEFIKRLCSKKHGIYRKTKTPIGGDIKILAVNRRGQVFECDKNNFKLLK